MTETSQPEPTNNRFNSVMRLFIVPLLIVIVSVGLFYAFGFLAFKTKTPEDFLYEIKTAGQSKKWQAAYSLAGMLVTEKEISAETQKTLTREILALFQNKEKYRAQVRSYLALALGYLKQPEAVPVLIEALQENDEDVVLYSVWSLTVLGDGRAQTEILPLIEDDRPAIRKIAAFSLGHFPGEDSVNQLKKALRDSEADVTWNAALALAQLGNSSGAFILEKLLNRNYLDGFPDLSDEEKEKIMINALYAMDQIRYSEAISTIKELSQSDPSLKVRKAAMDILKNL
jgi:HEAT repeat protein